MSAYGLQTTGWLVAYVALFIARRRFERWLVARFHNQRPAPVSLGGTRSRTHPLSATITVGGVLAGSLLAGAAIPLAPGMGPFGHASAGVLYVLAAIVAGTTLLPLVSSGRLDAQHVSQSLSAGGLLSTLSLLLTALAVITTGGALSTHGEGSLRLDRLVEAQAGWSGLRWIGILQPLALLLWLSCTSFLLRGLDARPTLAGQATKLNCALLGTALFLGGWQGPFVDRAAWLGLPYTVAKVLCLTFVWTWTTASLPRRALPRRAEVTWLLHVPLSALNLLVTAIVVAIGSH